MDIIDLSKSGRLRADGRRPAPGSNGEREIFTRIVTMQKCVEHRSDVFARRRIGELISELFAVSKAEN